MRRRLANWLCCVGYGLEARLEAFHHILRWHRLTWRCDIDLWTGHTGCIICHACADSSNGKTDVAIWCRNNMVLWWMGRTVCGWRGHAELRHPQRSLGWDDEKDEGIYEDIVDEWYCYRCLADVKPRSGSSVARAAGS